MDEAQLGDINKSFKDAMKDRVDLLANNVTADQLHETFSLKNLKKYESDVDDLTYEIKTIKGELVESEKNTATAFNQLLSNASGGGRNLAGTKYFNANLEGVDVTPYLYDKDKISNEGQYQLGREAISRIDKTKPIEDQISNIYDGKGKNTDMNSFREGIYSVLSEQGEKVYRNKEGSPARFVPINVNEIYRDSIEKQRNKESGINELGEDVSLPVGMKNYIDQYKYLMNISGDPYTASDQMGKAYKAW